MERIQIKQNSLLEREKSREQKPRRLPIAVVVHGEKKQVFVEHIIEARDVERECILCHKIKRLTNEVPIEEKIIVDSDDLVVIEQAKKKLYEMTDEIEKRMSVCDDCFDEDFIKSRLELYINTLESVQDEMGIEVDKLQQRRLLKGLE